MTQYVYLVASAVFSFVFVPVLSQLTPISPCPQHFRYTTDPLRGIEGRVVLPYDGSNSLYLKVNASMKGWYGKARSNMKLELLTPATDIFYKRTANLAYSLAFPVQEAIPRITDINLNGRDFCRGPPEPLYPTYPITVMSATHKFTVTVQRDGKDADRVSEDDGEYLYPEDQTVP